MTHAFKLLLLILSATYAASASSYYLAPSGNDANDGLSAESAWASPHHNLNCGDTITAASGDYKTANFYRGKWGTVACPASNNVVWLNCMTFDTCKITVTSGSSQGMIVDQSYWGVQGWEVSVYAGAEYGSCFTASPSSNYTIHHIIFANDIANRCATGGFDAYLEGGSTAASVDYIVYIGDIAYDASGTTVNGSCGSGFNVYSPQAADSSPGTHIYVAGNYSWQNTNGDPCDGHAPTDGEGINLDTFDLSQTPGGQPYLQQAVVENNLEFLNGGNGIEVENNIAGLGGAPIFIRQNTQYGDRRDGNQGYCLGNGDLDLYRAGNVMATYNLIYSGYPFDCPPSTTAAFFAVSVGSSNSSTVVDYNFLSGVGGNDLYTDGVGGFTFGSHNIVGTNPAFASPSNPGPPSCSGFASVAACMAPVVANFKPTVSTAVGYGYQPPALTEAYDPLFPQWLCNANLPAGLVTMGCVTLNLSVRVQSK